MNQEQKIKDLKQAIKNLRLCQDELRLARAQYNQAVTSLVDRE
jgi:hypothetical protein